MMKNERPDYFVEAPSVEAAVLHGIKGNFRRGMVGKSLLTEAWLLYRSLGEHTIYQSS